MARMTTPAQPKPRRWVMWLGPALVLAVIAGFVIAGAIHSQNATQDRVDGYYCTLSGVGPFDEAPSGRLCAEVG